MQRRISLVLCGALALACTDDPPAGFSQTVPVDAGLAPPVDAAADAIAVTDARVADAVGDAAPPDAAAACTVTVPGDQPTVAAAVAAAADGDVICVAAGDLTESLSLSNIAKSLTLRGAAGHATRWAAPPSDAGTNVTSLTVRGSPGAGHRLVIEGISFGCAGRNLYLFATAGRIEVRGNVFDNACGLAVNYENFHQGGSTDILFEQNEHRAGQLVVSAVDPGNTASARVILKNSLFLGVASATLSTDTAWMSFVVTGTTWDLDPGVSLMLLAFGSDLGDGSLVSDSIFSGGDSAFSCASCDSLHVTRNIFHTNADIHGEKLPATNLLADPLFVAADDHHLLPYSPAVYFDARTPGADPDVDLEVDLDGVTRPTTRIDVGAYQHR